MNRPKRTRRDANQAEIVRALRSLGAVVWDLSDVGGQVLDLIVFWRGRTRVVEIKRPGHEDDLTSNERASMVDLLRMGVEPIVATCWQDVVAAWLEEG